MAAFYSLGTLFLLTYSLIAMSRLESLNLNTRHKQNHLELIFPTLNTSF